MLHFQHYPHHWFLPCISGSFHSTYTKNLTLSTTKNLSHFNQRLPSFIYKQMSNSLHSYKALRASTKTNTKCRGGLYRPIPHSKGLFIHKHHTCPYHTAKVHSFINIMGLYRPTNMAMVHSLIKHHGSQNTHKVWSTTFKQCAAKANS